MSLVLNYGRCKQIDVIIGLDLSKNTNESQFDQQRQFFQELIEGLYLFNDTDTSYRVGVFAYDDTIIKPKNKLWPLGNMTEFEAKEALKPFNYSIDQNNPYLDHALRFVLASLDDDRSNNKDRECSEKILVLVVTDIVEKWSNGKRDLARLKTMGVKTLFVVVGKAADSELLKGEEILIVSSFNNSMDIQTNASHFLRNILEEGKGSCCDSSFSANQLKDTRCSTQMGNMCDIICSGVFDTKVVLATCEPNGVWSSGKEDACKGFGLHVVSLVIGAGSSLVFLVVVAMFVFLLRRKKCQSKKRTITPAFESPIHRSVRNNYSAPSSQMLAAEQAKVESDEDSDESDAVVYDYAEEDAVNAISKRPVKSKEDIHKNGKKNNIDIVHFNAQLGLGINYNNDTDMLNKPIEQIAPLACNVTSEGTWHAKYDDDEIYMNQENETEDNQEIYMNTLIR